MNTISIYAASNAQLIFATQPTNTSIYAIMAPVVVRLVDTNGISVAQSGVAVSLSSARIGLQGATNVLTDTNGAAVFSNLFASTARTRIRMTASAPGLKSVRSGRFNVAGAETIVQFSSSSNSIAYGQSVTLTATVAAVNPALGVPGGKITFKDRTATLATVALDSNGLAFFTTSELRAADTNHLLSAVYSGGSNFLASTSSILFQAVSQLPVTISGILASNKIYDGNATARLDFSGVTLGGVLAGDIVNVAKVTTGSFADASVGSNKTVSIPGLKLSGGDAGNYFLIPPLAAADILPRNLIITAKGVDKVYDGTSNAVVSLSDNRVTGDTFTNGYTAAAFTNKNAGLNLRINVTGLFIGGTNAENYVLSNLNTMAIADITRAPLTVSGVMTSNKVYDSGTVASLNTSGASLATVYPGDDVSLIVTNAKGAFSSATVGAAKAVKITGLALAGADATNYTLTSSVTNVADITPRSLTITAKGVNKVYDGSTNATVTLSDNRVSGDQVTNHYTSAFFASPEVGTNVLISVYDLTITGADATNYILAASNTACFAKITRAPLTVSGVTANDKVYDRTTVATLNFDNATLAPVFAGDIVALDTNSAKGVFASRDVGTNIQVAVSGLALSGASSNNYSLTQPATMAGILPRSLVITAKGVRKTYDGTTNATVVLSDNRVSGDVLTNSYTFAAFTNKNVGMNILINVYGLAMGGADAPNYALVNTNTTTATNIVAAQLIVTAASVSRPYGTTNPVLFAVYSNFVAGESLTNSDVTGAPMLSTTAKTNSNVGAYSITVGKGTLASANYSFKFVKGVLTITKADSVALLTTTLNPARTNQNITFTAAVNPATPTAFPVTGTIQFRCNATNALGSPVSLAAGKANYTVVGAVLGQTDAVITVEYSDPAGNFNPSTNSLVQTLVAAVVAPPPSSLSLAPSVAGGSVTAEISGVAGQTYVIEASTDLSSWTSISTNVADLNGIVSLVDSNALVYPMRFYRAYSP